MMLWFLLSLAEIGTVKCMYLVFFKAGNGRFESNPTRFSSNKFCLIVVLVSFLEKGVKAL